MSELSKYCLIGISDHQGVMNVGGRLGAASGPEAFRADFARLSGRVAVQSAIRDLGDVLPVSTDVRDTHERAAQLISQAHAKNDAISLVVGGGHDHGYSHLLGVSRALAKRSPGARLACINVDAHLDVRPPLSDGLITSGSPFYLALESGVLKPDLFVEFGIQSHCNAAGLWNYVNAKGVRIVHYPELRNGRAPQVFESLLRFLAQKCDAVVVSFDLDAVASAFAPGVSAPQAEGLSSSDAIEIAEISARHSKVVSLGLFELNPLHDEGRKTSKLAATMGFHFFATALECKI